MAESGLLSLWLALSARVAPLARWHLQRRLARGKEDPARLREKMGEASLPRPPGTLVWIHAVGVGEVLALPALVEALRARRPGLSVLITSSSRTSAAALAPNLPQGAFHQFLPLDAEAFVARFLDHWRPDLSVWAERDVWPVMIEAVRERGIPLALINARMNAASFRAKGRARRLYPVLYSRFAFVSAQDEDTARHFRALGVDPARLNVTGTLKAGAAPLADQPQARVRLEGLLQGRRCWIAASTHPGDEAGVIAAQKDMLRHDPATILVIAPRDPARAAEVAGAARAAGLDTEIVAPGNRIGRAASVLVLSEIGQLGLWYRLADAAFVGGSFATTGGHNPYEPARLDCAVLHGPNVANFAGDYAAFHAADAARMVEDGAALATALRDPALAETRGRAAIVAARGRQAVEAEAERLLSLLPGPLNPGG
ncbi:3-deoxy-D-manno-octulosonic acid transferase [Halodurantibacterium flavum]|uniref:3-deoxy-D-manno-octulosonic acid transferase n=1 Tax=Halodurantibacterium flavum TaxID=1382802 RepID=A0ABW4S9Q2_9RHOB